MRIVAIADQHGHLPEIPNCDLLLIAGDVCPLETHDLDFQRRWLEEEFARWLAGPACRAERVAWIAGNHDLALETTRPGPVLREAATYLIDSAVEIGGLRIYGTPWTEIIGPWAFSLPERQPPDPRRPDLHWFDLERVFTEVPLDADIVLCHGPPEGILDRTVGGEHCGSPSLLRRLRLVCPRLVVFGHIHEARGHLVNAWEDRDGTMKRVELVNASLVDERYRLRHQPVVIEL